MKEGKRLLSLALALFMLAALWTPSALAIDGAYDGDGRMVQRVDLIETYGTTLHVVGWVYDSQNPSATVTIDVDYAKGIYYANKAKGSANSTCPVSGNHYFDFAYSWSNGEDRVMIHSMHTDGSGPCLLYDNGGFFTGIYKITYNANGGSGAPAADYKHRAIPVRLSNTKPTRTGYIFKGWATSSTGGVVYQPGKQYTANTPVTLYAVWEAERYAVTYDANGGEGAPAAQTKTYGAPLTLSGTAPTREGYIFLGWARHSDDEQPEFQPGDPYTANAALALYALWRIARVPGDVNGDQAVDGADGVALLQYLAELPVTIEARNADVNNDGVVDGRDALRLMKYLAGQNVGLE